MSNNNQQYDSNSRRLSQGQIKRKNSATQLTDSQLTDSQLTDSQLTDSKQNKYLEQQQTSQFMQLNDDMQKMESKKSIMDILPKKSQERQRIALESQKRYSGQYKDNQEIEYDGGIDSQFKNTSNAYLMAMANLQEKIRMNELKFKMSFQDQQEKCNLAIYEQSLKYENEMDKMRNNFNSMENNLRQRLQMCDNEKKVQESYIESMQKIMKEKDSVIQQIQQMKNEQGEQIIKLEDDKNNQLKNIIILNEQLEIQKLENQKFYQTIQSNQDEKRFLNMQNSELNEVILKNNQKIDSLQHKVNKYESTVNQIEYNQKQLQAQLEESYLQKKIAQQEIKNLDEQLFQEKKSNDQKIAQINEKILNVEKQLNESLQNNQNQKITIQKLFDEKLYIQDIVKKNEDIIQQLNQKIQDLFEGAKKFENDQIEKCEKIKKMELELIEKSLQIEENQHAYNLEKEALNFKYDELNDINKKCQQIQENELNKYIHEADFKEQQIILLKQEIQNDKKEIHQLILQVEFLNQKNKSMQEDNEYIVQIINSNKQSPSKFNKFEEGVKAQSDNNFGLHEGSGAKPKHITQITQQEKSYYLENITLMENDIQQLNQKYQNLQEEILDFVNTKDMTKTRQKLIEISTIIQLKNQELHQYKQEFINFY